jgi:hypothetical protein
MIASRFFAIGVDRANKASIVRGRLLAVIAASAFMLPLGGCSGEGTGGTGEGTVDISHAKDAANTNPDMAKAAAARGAGGIGDTQKGGKKGRN